MIRVVGAVVLATSVAFTGAVVASANGGGSIATAPDLLIGQQVTGGAAGDYAKNEFWRITLQQADHLIIDYGSTNGYNVGLCVIDAPITDYTVNRASCLVEDSTDHKSELTYIAPAPGRYTLLVGDGINSIGSNNCCWYDLAYELTARVQHYTSVQVTGPPTVTQGSKISYSGSITGGVSGGQLVVYGARGNNWIEVAVLSTGNNGFFHYTTRAGDKGTFRFKFSYIGDNQHLPSSSVKVLKVV